MAKLRPQPTNLEGFTDLDARVSPQLGRELADEIIAAVEWSQQFFKLTLPDRLIVTQKQFVSLQSFTEEMYHTEERVFITPMNAMQVVIDRDIDTIPEVADILREVDDHPIHDHVDYPTDEPNEP